MGLMAAHVKRSTKEGIITICAVLEYLCGEILNNAGNIVMEKEKHLLMPKHLLRAFKEDDDIVRMYNTEVWFKTEAGRLPKEIHQELLPKKKQKEMMGEKSQYQ